MDIPIRRCRIVGLRIRKETPMKEMTDTFFDLLEDPKTTENADKVLTNRYLRRDGETGEVIEIPKEMFYRVADAIASPEEERLEWTHRFYDMMASGKFMPNSPTLMNAGRNNGNGLSACYVLGVEDSLDSIYTTLKDIAMVQKTGGGCGMSFSKLRPEGDIVASSGGATSGPLCFIDAYSAGSEAVQQGSFRRGANMGNMSCDHPDVIEFIRAKADLNRWNNYNISVTVTDTWMENLKRNPDMPMVVTNPRSGKCGLLEKTTGRRISKVDYKAYESDVVVSNKYWTYKEVFDMIVHYAWKNGEPGMLFLDRANETNQVPHLGEYYGSNPCGEQILLANSSCNLGSINLSHFISSEERRSQDWHDLIDWHGLEVIVQDSVRFLDNVITVNDYPTEGIAEMAKLERRIGLGVMGFADMLIKMRIPYGSELSIDIAEEISSFITKIAIEFSESLCEDEERDPFGAWEGSTPQKLGLPKRRNSYVTTVAPTGTISIIAGCSGGIEPIFSYAYKRQVMKDSEGIPVTMNEVHPALLSYMEGNGYSEEDIDTVVDIAMTDGTIRNTNLPPFIKEVFVTARDVTPMRHVMMQAAWQRGIDNSVSKTINMAHEATENDVREAYLLAFDLGCKGITVYRDGSRDMQPMALKNSGENGGAKDNAFKLAVVPDILPAYRIKQPTPFGNMHVKITYDESTGKDLEIFAQVGKAGEVINGDLEAMCRVASLFLRSGGDIDSILGQWEGIGTSMAIPTREGRVMSLGDGLAKAISKYKLARSGAKNTVAEIMTKTAESPSIMAECPSCENVSVAIGEGCVHCESCGWSAC